MDEILPVTLLDIIESIGKRNDCTGYKIYSSGCKTNIVIHFLDSQILTNDQSCETKSSEEMQLKASTYSKRRSPCNQLRDMQRVKDHNKNNLFQATDCQPSFESKSTEKSLPGDDNPILSRLSAEQDDSKQTQENDSGFSPTLDSSQVCNSQEQSPSAGATTEEEVTETQQDNDKNNDSNFEQEQDKSKSFGSKSNSIEKKSKFYHMRSAANKTSWEQMQRNYDRYLARRYEYEHHGPYHPHRYPSQYSASHNSAWNYYQDT